MASQGINFRDTAGFVTDPANTTNTHGNGSFNAADSYPTTRGSPSETFGYTSSLGTINTRDDSAAIDARIAGLHIPDSGTTGTFRLDLSDGGGTYDITIGSGRQAFNASNIQILVQDNGVTVFTVSFSGTLADGHYIDANNTEFTSAANWASGQATKRGTFSSGILTLACGDATHSGQINHVNATFVSAAGKTPYQPNYQRGPILAQ